jgi:DNA-binding XRE family transcriptional regulator
MNVNKEIALRVKKYRKLNKFSQEDIADILGISRPNYVNLESGKQNWQTNYLYKLCCIFNCKPTSIFPSIVPLKLKFRNVKKTIVRVKKKYYATKK